MLGLVAYIHLNPVRDGICQFPKQYKWSSYGEYMGLPGYSICDKNLIEGYNLKGQSFKEFVLLANQVSAIEAFDQ